MIPVQLCCPAGLFLQNHTHYEPPLLKDRRVDLGYIIDEVGGVLRLICLAVVCVPEPGLGSAPVRAGMWEVGAIA